MAGDKWPQIKTRRDSLERLVRECHQRHSAQKEIGEHTESVIAARPDLPRRHVPGLKKYPKAATRYGRQGLELI